MSGSSWVISCFSDSSLLGSWNCNRLKILIHKHFKLRTCLTTVGPAGLTGPIVSTTLGCEEKRKTWAASGSEAAVSSRRRLSIDTRRRRPWWVVQNFFLKHNISVRAVRSCTSSFLSNFPFNLSHTLHGRFVRSIDWLGRVEGRGGLNYLALDAGPTQVSVPGEHILIISALDPNQD